MAAILNFMAEHPGQAFTLTDLVKALKLSRATCHALLTGLVEVGYLYRASDKNYVLGPTLASIGRIAAQHASPLQVAQPEMRALADEFGAICSAFFREREEIVVRDRATSMSHVGWSVPMGARLKLRPPFAAIFFSSLPQAEIEAWLDSYTPVPTAEQRADMTKGMAFIREHGFMLQVRDPNLPTYDMPPEQAFGEAHVEYPTCLVSELDPDHWYRLAGVVAPVFDARGQVAFTLGLSGITEAMQGAELERIGRRLREACDRVTGFITGAPLAAVGLAKAS